MAERFFVHLKPDNTPRPSSDVREQVIEIVNNARQNGSSPDLSKLRLGDGADLSNLDLSGATFGEEQYLEFTNFSGADLSDACLKKTKICGAIFENAKLNGADLSGVTSGLPGANFNNANMEGACLKEACFHSDKFNNANLSRATANNALFLDNRMIGAIFANAQLSQVEFSGCSLEEVSFESANMREVRFDKNCMLDCKTSFSGAKNFHTVKNLESCTGYDAAIHNAAKANDLTRERTSNPPKRR